MSVGSDQDRQWMQEALALARNGEGLTRPNPPVGAVVVRDGVSVGRGYHQRAGGPHAEIYALKDAGDRARGATLFVTLEPCSTIGRTGSCTDAIVAAGVGRVVIGTRDPNPIHAGRGLRLLRRAGVEVTAGVERTACERLIEPFQTWILQRRPFVTLKLAMTLDGRIADRDGASRWITGAPARSQVQALRRTADAVLVGANTVRADDPSLLPRPARKRRPFRVVVAGRGGVSPSARLCTDPAAPRTWIAAPAHRAQRLARELASTPVQVLPVAAASAGRLGLRDLLEELAARDVMHVVCEGGGRLAADLIRAGLVDEWVLFYGPSLMGGDGIPAVASAGWRMAGRPKLRLLSVESVGKDFMVRARSETRGA